MKKSLAATNPYLHKPGLKRDMVRHFVSTSSAIEGIHIAHHTKRLTIKKRASTSRGKA